MQQKVGPSFSLEKFCDEFLRQGGVPLPVVRRAMLGTRRQFCSIYCAYNKGLAMLIS
jgi:hypothetical protein